MILTLCVGFPVVQAQQAQSADIKIEVRKTEAGNIQVQQDNIPAGEAGDLKDLLRQYGLDDELKNLQPGEEIEIIVRRKKKDQVIRDYEFDLDYEALQAPAQDKKPMLGVYFKTDTDSKGSLITEVIPGSAADIAGLEKNDVVVDFGGEELSVGRNLRSKVLKYKAGDKVEVLLLRGGNEKTVQITLGEFDNSMGREEFRKAPCPSGPIPQGLRRLEIEQNTGSNQAANRPMLGVSLNHNVTMVNGKIISDEDSGIKITDVIEGTAAKAMGLQKGDEITHINSNEVNDQNDIAIELKKIGIGEDVTVTYNRAGQNKTATAELTAWKGQGSCNKEIKIHLNDMLNQGNIEEMVQQLQSGDENVFTYKMNGNSLSENQGEVTEFRMTIRMEELNAEEAEALSAVSGDDFGGQSNLALNSLEVAPNPSSGVFKLAFDLPEAGNTSIKVLDLNGEEIYQEKLGHFSGKFKKDFDISGFAKGVYFLRVQQGEKAFTKKIITQ